MGQQSHFAPLSEGCSFCPRGKDVGLPLINDSRHIHKPGDEDIVISMIVSQCFSTPEALHLFHQMLFFPLHMPKPFQCSLLSFKLYAFPHSLLSPYMRVHTYTLDILCPLHSIPYVLLLYSKFGPIQFRQHHYSLM